MHFLQNYPQAFVLSLSYLVPLDLCYICSPSRNSFVSTNEFYPNYDWL
jgi:hypothetical protein